MIIMIFVHAVHRGFPGVCVGTLAATTWRNLGDWLPFDPFDSLSFWPFWNRNPGLPWHSMAFNFSTVVESLCRATSCKCQCILFALKALPHMKRWSNVWHVSEMDTHIHIYSTAKTHWISHGQWILKPANLIDLHAGVLPSSFWGHRL